MRTFGTAVLVLCVGLWGGVLQADESGTAKTRGIHLVDGEGSRHEIGMLETAADGTYEITFSDSAFTDHFLSMRPFKCLEGPEKHWCHVPYPYEIRRNLSEDLVDLEYDLLFLWKGATDYGIDTWNGIYYVLEDVDGQIRGTAHDIDLGGLAVPPPPGTLRPVRASDLHETDPDSHWLPGLVIE